MRIIVYPETVDGNIGHFDDTDVQACLLIQATAEDLKQVDLIFMLCELLHNPTAYIDSMTSTVPFVKLKTPELQEIYGVDTMFARMDRGAIIACADGEGLTEEDAVEYLKDDIRQMIRTANLIFETHPHLIPTLDDIFLDECVSIMANLATALEVVLMESVPLKPRFDIIESEGVRSLSYFEEIIDALKTYKDE